MKRLLQFILILSVLLTPWVFSTEVSGQDGNYYTVYGVVKDQKSKRTLEYVNISIPGKNIGTVTNSDGAFSLKVSRAENVREFEISHLGYISSRVAISPNSSSDETVYYLTPNTILLDAVTVSPVEARDIISGAVKKISSNYPACPAMLTGFYRETIQKGRRYVSVSEAVTDVFKTPYTEDSSRERTRISKGRQIISPRAKDTLAVKLLGGPTQPITLDIVKTPYPLFDSESIEWYNFEFIDYVIINDRLHYNIRFRPRVTLPFPLYEGNYYIDKETLAFSRAEFNTDMRSKEKVTRQILRKKPAGLIFSPHSVTYLVTYRTQNGISYLSYIQNEIKFRCDWKKKFFRSNYTVCSEVVITDRKDYPGETIPYKEAFRENHILSDKIFDFYDENFWGEYNIIEPTESLESAMRRLKKMQWK